MKKNLLILGSLLLLFVHASCEESVEKSYKIQETLSNNTFNNKEISCFLGNGEKLPTSEPFCEEHVDATFHSTMAGRIFGFWKCEVCGKWNSLCVNACQYCYEPRPEEE